jgi:CRP-like cAMP-binding protein
MPNQSRLLEENYILSHLGPEESERIKLRLEPVELQHGQILHHAGDTISQVYFPRNSMISLIAQTIDGQSVETGIVGFEGMAGISAVLGVDKSPHQALVQIPGDGLRLSVRALREEFKHCGSLHDLLLRYIQGIILHTSQLAACNRLHSISERLARWLLMSYDRCQCDDLPFTQEFLAMMLGVRRAGVTEAAIILQTEGYIRYRRGNIKIIDRAALEHFACDCYAIVKEEFLLMTGQAAD